MGRLTGRDEACRERWASFLRPLVGAGGAVSVAALDRLLAERTGRGGAARGEISAYLNSRQTIGPERAFNIGETLKCCGLRWCSGAIALWAAGRYEDYFDLLAALWPSRPRIAIELFYCAPLIVANPDDSSRSYAQRVCEDHEAVNMGQQRHTRDHVFAPTLRMLRAIGTEPLLQELEAAAFAIADPALRRQEQYASFYSSDLSTDGERRRWKSLMLSTRRVLFGSDFDTAMWEGASYRETLGSPPLNEVPPAPPILKPPPRRGA